MTPLILRAEEAMGMPAEVLKRLIVDHKIAVVRNHECSVDHYVAFMSRLGEPVHHVLAQHCLSEHRAVLKISNLYRDGTALGVHEGGAYWHTDMSYKHANTVFTSLWSIMTPSHGGYTEFIDCVAGLEQVRAAARPPGVLSGPLQGIDLDAARIQHAFGNRETRRDRDAATQVLTPHQQHALEDKVFHPLVLKHPLHGVPSLYSVGGTAMAVEGRSAEDSAQVLDGLFDFLVTHAPRYRHHYRRGDIVIWDNLSTLHRGPALPASHDEDDCRMLYRMNIDYLKGEAA